ncbi:MAG TPA: 5-methyltetrahydropteroyltriglutamate--homocysteine S-methyltransferase [Acidimicrobiales bacterium]|nr:5-methyltetrahydropteroyltriglutamate--homocysteine S-methyltransferase [Acidimicrobiales bacterium]
MAHAINLGMPRIGPARELKRAVERYWAGRIDAPELARVAAARRADAWRVQRAAGIDSIPSNDFSLYDQVLDTCCLVGAVPDRFGWDGDSVDLDTSFALARGTERDGVAVPPLEMTKWFDTNYHYLVPELGPDTQFRLASTKPVDELVEARDLGIATRPVLIGPVTFLLLATPTEPGFSPLSLLQRLLPVYARVLADLAAAGATWVQLDEPCLVTDLDDRARDAYRNAYTVLARAADLRLLVATYFGGLGDNVDVATGLPVDGLHVDLVRAPDQLAPLLDRFAPGPDDPQRVGSPPRVLSLGVVDGRNVWRTDLDGVLDRVADAHRRLGDRLWIGPSCSLQHVPHDVGVEDGLDPTVRDWLAFADQKLDEVGILAAALGRGGTPAGGLAAADPAVAERLAASRRAVEDRRVAQAEAPDRVRRRSAVVTAEMASRPSPHRARAEVQQRSLGLPVLPTTTIGSFPQTAEIRRARRKHDVGELTDDEYAEFCRAEIAQVVRTQEELGLDVLVHGEPERNDMVQYFGERLAGFVTTAQGWVQSYGTRCVRPPILFGDVERPAPMTVEWAGYASSLTDRPVKGMLTGPVTILQWSFVRDDQPRHETCRQIALAIRDEVADLEAAGIGIIQVDEPALREGLPLRVADHKRYLDWATECFRLATSGVDDSTQIHTHMCYAEFGDIIDAIVALDADVISIEATRSRMEVLADLVAARYPAGVGPGVYDIHSPLVPSEEEIAALLDRALAALPAGQLWVNPDCGLKTRDWDEVRPALAGMVAAARSARERLANTGEEN